MDYKVEGERSRSRPKKLGSEVTEKDTRQVCNKDAMDHRKWR